MAREEGQQSNPETSKTIWSFLAEPIKLAAKNPKLGLILVAVSFFPHLLLSLLAFNVTQRSDYASTHLDLFLVFVGILYAAKLGLIVLQWIMVIQSVDVTRLEKPLTLKDLIDKFRNAWGRLALTILLMDLLLGLYVGTLRSVVIILLILLLQHHKVVLGLSLAVLSIPAILSIAYAFLIAKLAEVSSAVERSGCCGIGVIRRTIKVLQGRNKQGLLLSLGLLGINLVTVILFYALSSSSATLATVGIVATKALLAIYDAAVFAIFYEDCRAGMPSEDSNVCYHELPVEED